MPDAPGLVLSPTATVGRDVVFGAHVVVHAGVVLGDGVVVQDGAILGKQPVFGPALVQRGRPAAAGLVIEEGARIGTHAVVFAGAHVGAGRDRRRPGLRPRAFPHRRRTRSSGRATAVDNDVVVGARVRLQSNVYMTAYSVVEDDVFVGPCAMTTNDDTIGRMRPGEPMRGATLRRACRIGGGAVLVPGVEVGEEAFVAAGAVVTNDVAAPRGRHGRSGAVGARAWPTTTCWSGGPEPRAISRPPARRAARRRVPGAVELPGARRRREVAEQRTRALAVVALAATSVVGAGEVARVWHRGRRRRPSRPRASCPRPPRR